MTMTAQGREAEYGDELGRCEGLGCLVSVADLVSLEIGGEEFLLCPTCVEYNVENGNVVIL